MENKLAIFLCFLCAVSCNVIAESAATLTKDDVNKQINEAITEKEKSTEKQNQKDIINKLLQTLTQT